MIKPFFSSPVDLARYSIIQFITTDHMPNIFKKNIADNLKTYQSCFVTLHINGKLRGCIGNVEPIEPLWKNIINNAISAATGDLRFVPIDKNEINKMQIEASILTKTENFIAYSLEYLLSFLKNSHPGLIMQSGNHRALFLPQVWNDLPDPEDFLSHLCLKAGLSSKAYKEIGIKYQTFNVEKFDS